jgi:hypothetical protein
VLARNTHGCYEQTCAKLSHRLRVPAVQFTSLVLWSLLTFTFTYVDVRKQHLYNLILCILAKKKKKEIYCLLRPVACSMFYLPQNDIHFTILSFHVQVIRFS